MICPQDPMNINITNEHPNPESKHSPVHLQQKNNSAIPPRSLHVHLNHSIHLLLLVSTIISDGHWLFSFAMSNPNLSDHNFPPLFPFLIPHHFHINLFSIHHFYTSSYWLKTTSTLYYTNNPMPLTTSSSNITSHHNINPILSYTSTTSPHHSTTSTTLPLNPFTPTTTNPSSEQKK